MTVKVGVIGVGMIGQDHIRRLTKVLAGAAVTAVSDMDLARATSVAESIECGCRGRHLVGSHPRAVRHGRHRRRQARVL